MPSYVDDAADYIRRLMQGAGVVLPPPGAAQVARRIDGPMPDFSNVKGLDVAPGLDAPDFSKIVDHGVPVEPNMAFGTPAWDDMARTQDAAQRVIDNLRTGRTANLRNQPFAGIGGQAIREADQARALKRKAMEASAERGELMTDAALIGGGVAAAGGLGAGAVMLVNSGAKPPSRFSDAVAAAPSPSPAHKGSADDPLFSPKPALTSTSGTAELANQSRPVPEVPASTDPREQAQAMIAKLNQMRRAAGGEVKEAPQMMADINRLLAMSDKSRNASPPGGAYDYHMQAQSIIAKLNAMRKQAGGEVPQAAQMMAEARRLQSMGDQRRNAMQTR